MLPLVITLSLLAQECPGMTLKQIINERVNTHALLVFWQGRQSWGVGGSRPPRFWAGWVVGVAGELQGGRGQVVNYYYILSCTGSMFESDDFEEKWNNLPRSSCKCPIFAWKFEILLNFLKNRNFCKFIWKNRN